MTQVKNSVLIVDDNPTNLNLLVDYLTKKDFEIFAAEDGESALELIEYAIPDIILLDVMMPGIDGLETCRRLKAIPKIKEVPIIFMTALTDVSSKVAAFEAGGIDYITKPIQHQEVLARVNTHISLRKLQKNLQEQNILLEQEIQERKRAEDTLRRYTTELEASNAELDAFAHTVAHDLKTPLFAILGFSSAIKDDLEKNLLAKVKEDLTVIIQNAHRSTNIINELLLLASIRKQHQVKITPLNMQAIVTEVLDRLNVVIEEAQANISIPKKWPVAIGYAPWIEEVWVNYISNAIKYGGFPPKIELGATPQANGKIRFWVRDNGKGLSEEEQKQLFTQFTRLHQIRAEGHGLGLSIVQRILHRLKGETGVESELEQGSTFYFILAAEHPNQVDTQSYEPELSSVPSPPPLDIATIAALPQSWQDNLYQAAAEADTEAVIALIDKITPDTNEEFIIALKQLVHNYKYETILNLLEQAK